MKRPADAVPFEMPSACPECGEAVVREEGEVAVRCVSASLPGAGEGGDRPLRRPPGDGRGGARRRADRPAARGGAHLRRRGPLRAAGRGPRRPGTLGREVGRERPRRDREVEGGGARAPPLRPRDPARRREDGEGPRPALRDDGRPPGRDRRRPDGGLGDRPGDGAIHPRLARQARERPAPVETRGGRRPYERTGGGARPRRAAGREDVRPDGDAPEADARRSDGSDRESRRQGERKRFEEDGRGHGGRRTRVASGRRPRPSACRSGPRTTSTRRSEASRERGPPAGAARPRRRRRCGEPQGDGPHADDGRTPGGGVRRRRLGPLAGDRRPVRRPRRDGPEDARQDRDRAGDRAGGGAPGRLGPPRDRLRRRRHAPEGEGPRHRRLRRQAGRAATTCGCAPRPRSGGRGRRARSSSCASGSTSATDSRRSSASRR